MLFSIVIPTYNRLPILSKCLVALEAQKGLEKGDHFEVVLVDDGSTDGTVAWLQENQQQLTHVRLVCQEHGGPALGRNLGVREAKGEVIIFIDSDLVVLPSFLVEHSRALRKSWQDRGNRLCFTYGAVINTHNFEFPCSEPHKLSDLSWAYFATGNVAIDRSILVQSGLFDPAFQLYGWEDLELGERLRRMGVLLVRCPAAVGYHWHPALSLEQLPDLVRKEQERARMGLVFYRKHPTRRVRFIIQYTALHRLLWDLLTLGGILNVNTLKPLLAWLIKIGKPGLAMELLRLPLNRIGVEAMFKQARQANW